MRRFVPVVLGIYWITAGATTWAAKNCGDDVEGQDVPCACGDILVSGLVAAGDPVFAAPCDGDGLVVRATSATSGVTIDLKGRTLRGGDRGAGLWIVDGGPGGARLVSSGGRAAIEGFRDGIVSRGSRSIALVENVDVRRPGRDGLRLKGDGYRVLSVAVEDAGRDGISLDGRDFACQGSRASRSGRFGFQVNGRAGSVGLPGAIVTAEDSGSDGFHVMGSGHRLNLCQARRNRRHGVRVRGSGLSLTGCEADANGSDGMTGEGGDIVLVLNRADGNARNGIGISGVRLVDGGGNSGEGNRGEGQQRAAIQCEIGGKPCET
jgi:hypothetical protein